MKTILITFLATLFIGFISCTPKVLSKGNFLPIKEAYTQKEIPGQKDAKIHTYLKMEFDLPQGDNVYIESVKFRGTTTPINSPSRRVRIQLSNAQLKNISSKKFEKATIYYQLDGKSYSKEIDNVGSKKDLYLP